MDLFEGILMMIFICFFIGGLITLQVLVLQFVWNFLVDFFALNIRHLDVFASFILLVFIWMIGGAFKSNRAK